MCGIAYNLSSRDPVSVFLLWDARKRRFQLVRDCFGEKPPYYDWCGRDCVFGPKLRAIGRVRAEIDS